MPFIIICSWCGKSITISDDPEDDKIKPGICNDCLNKYFPHQADKIREALEVENIEELFIGANNEKGFNQN